MNDWHLEPKEACLSEKPRSTPPRILDLGGGVARTDYSVPAWFSMYVLRTESGAPPQLIRQ